MRSRCGTGCLDRLSLADDLALLVFLLARERSFWVRSSVGDAVCLGMLWSF